MRLSLFFLLITTLMHPAMAARGGMSFCDLAMSGLAKDINLAEYVRFTDKNVRDPAKLILLAQNVQASVDQVLKPEVAAGTSTLHFESILRAQQSIIVGGGYQGQLLALDRNLNVVNLARDANPGRFIFELGFDLNRVFAKLDLLRLSEIPFHPEEFQKYFPLEGTEYRVSIEHLPEAILPINQRTLGRGIQFEHSYPKPLDIPLYVAELNKHFGEVIAKRGSPEFLPSLADYYHLFSNAHPFMVGNNSLAMSHVNFFLKAEGYPAISHGDLDILALVLPYTDFREVFISRVQAAKTGK